MICRGSIGGVLASLLAAMLVARAGPAAASIRCGTQIIDNGAPARNVLKYCGRPAVGNPADLRYGEWIYNFGPDEFMVKVIIQNGRLARTQSLGKGYVPPGGTEAEAPRYSR